MTEGPERRYRALVEDGELQADPAQARIAASLQRVYDELAAGGRGRGGLFRKPEPAKGLYIFGGVGRGKSLLMDMFFDAAPTARKRRAHFHDFMQEVHKQVFRWRNLSPKERARQPEYVKGAGDDPLAPAAQRIAQQAELLCFDEVQVTDIADAMILGRLFEAMFDFGVVMVATSNRAPEDLYQDGINRPLFTPFIDLLRERLEVAELTGADDYRKRCLDGAPVFFTPLGARADAAMEAAWRKLTAGAHVRAETVPVNGRAVTVPAAALGAARFAARDLSAEALGPADFLAIARRFHTVFLDAIPRLAPDKRNEAKRLVTLIDALYEHRCNLVASAAAGPEDLYPSGDGAFEFERTASRLMEMQSAAYREAPHRAGEAPADDALLAAGA